MNDTSDAQNSEVLYGVEDATATITLNRPERRQRGRVYILDRFYD